jgi:hypothetical protein
MGSSRVLPRQLRQFLSGLGVGFSADWVSRKQGGDRNLGSIATQAPWLSRHATGPSLFICPLNLSLPLQFHLRRFPLATTLAVAFLIHLRPVSADLTPSR